MLEPVPGRVERTLLHLQHILRGVLNDMRDGVTVGGPVTNVRRISISIVP